MSGSCSRWTLLLGFACDVETAGPSLRRPRQGEVWRYPTLAALGWAPVVVLMPPDCRCLFDKLVGRVELAYRKSEMKEWTE